MKAFNQNYPVSTTYAKNWRSLMTAQNGSSVNPALWLVSNLLYDIDGDGYCIDDCDGDGAAGQGDGWTTDRDDDGLVGMFSQKKNGWVIHTPYHGLRDEVAKKMHCFI